MNIINTIKLKKYYGKESTLVKAVDSVSLSIKRNQFVAIIGKSGSGKSTLLNLLSGLDRPTSGTVKIDNKDIFKMDEEDLTIFRRKNIGFVFQNFNLLPLLNAYENVILPIQLDNQEVDTVFADELFALLEIKDKKFLFPNDLSGGQQQRIAIARALINKPKIIFADEPTGNLDSHTSKIVLQLLKNLAKKYHQTIVMITHDMGIAKEADSILEIVDGKIVERGWDNE